MQKKILFISYYFPPNTAVGGLRIGDFARNFHLLGWKTYALTIKDKYLTQMDLERLKDLESTKIYKTSMFPTILNIILRLVFFLKRPFNKKVKIPYGSSRPFILPDLAPVNSEKCFQKLKRYFASIFIFLPDPEKRWILPAFLKAIWAIKREKISFILTSSPPHSVHITGLLLSIFTRTRWVADLRDPWFTCRNKMPHTASLLSKKIEAWLEKKVFQRANLVLATNEKLCHEFSKSYKEQPQEKFLCIPNGYDADAFLNIENLEKYDQFTISYAGTLYYGRSPEPLFDATKKLIIKGKLRIEDIRIKLIGDCGHVDGIPTSQMISAYDLDSVVEVIDPVPYFKCLEIIKRSHLALLLAPDQPFQVPAKVFDYFGSGTKILAIAGEGATSDLVRSTGAGASFYPSDIEGIEQFIFQSVRTNAESKKPENNPDILHQFDRKVIISDFAEHLRSVL